MPPNAHYAGSNDNMSFRDIIKQIREVDPTDNYLVKIVKLIPA